MKINILNYLACPTCHGALVCLVNKKSEERMLSGELKCRTCNKKFYVKNSIACFVSACKKPTKKVIQKLRKTTVEQEIPKKWMRLYSRQEIGALKKEWDWMLSIIKKGERT